jgi:Flp pilus assembly protein TadG
MRLSPQFTRKNAGRGRRRGSVLVEFTLSLSFLVALFLGIWQFGYAFYLYAELEQSVRAGARYAAQIKYDSATSTPTSTFLTSVQNVVVYGDPAPAAGAATVTPGLTTGNVALTVTFTLGVPTSMAVAITGYQLPTYFGSATLINRPTEWFPFIGIFGPP